MPWGGSRGGAGTTLTDYGFNGQRSMEGSIGLQYFNARWYDSSLGRWTQPDSIVSLASQGVQAWNRYEFVNNNPIGNTDTNGHQIDCHEVGCVTPGTTTTNAGQKYLNDLGSENKQGSNKNNKTGGTPQQPPTLNNPPYGYYPNYNPQSDPYHCTTLCFAPVPPGYHWWWDTNPKDPDYYTLTVNLGDLYGGTLTLTLTRYGQSYLGAGGNIGKSFTFPAGTLNGGWIGSAKDNVMPDQANMDNFFTGLSFNGSIGAVADIGGNWSPFAGDNIPHTSIEYGIDAVASLGASGTLGFRLFDFARVFGGN
jgi:RHS repeat-associated protein